MEHTKTPWIQGDGIKTNVFNEGGLRVVRADFDGDLDHPEAIANAAFIVEACNAYEGLKSTVQSLTARVEGLESHAMEFLSAYRMMPMSAKSGNSEQSAAGLKNFIAKYHQAPTEDK